MNELGYAIPGSYLLWSCCTKHPCKGPVFCNPSDHIGTLCINRDEKQQVVGRSIENECTPDLAGPYMTPLTVVPKSRAMSGDLLLTSAVVVMTLAAT